MNKETILTIKLVIANIIIILFVIGSMMFNISIWTITYPLFISGMVFIYIGLGLTILYYVLLLIFYIVKKSKGDINE